MKTLLVYFSVVLLGLMALSSAPSNLTARDDSSRRKIREEKLFKVLSVSGDAHKGGNGIKKMYARPSESVKHTEASEIMQEVKDFKKMCYEVKARLEK